jgi:hypothetical protein
MDRLLGARDGPGGVRLPDGMDFVALMLGGDDYTGWYDGTMYKGWVCWWADDQRSLSVLVGSRAQSQSQ